MSSFVLFVFSLFENGASYKYFVPLLPFSLCVESTLYIFLPVSVFLPCDPGLNFGISLLCENSSNESNKDKVSFLQGMEQTIVNMVH